MPTRGSTTYPCTGTVRQAGLQDLLVGLLSVHIGYVVLVPGCMCPPTTLYNLSSKTEVSSAFGGS